MAVKCGSCNGTGQHITYDKNGKAVTVTCTFCGGTGRIGK